jgi:hypothetical protein
MILAVLTAAKPGTAQLFFLIAAICAGLGILFGFFGREADRWATPVLVLLVLFFVSLGALFAA